MKLNRVFKNSNMQTKQNEQLNFDIKKKTTTAPVSPKNGFSGGWVFIQVDLVQ